MRKRILIIIAFTLFRCISFAHELKSDSFILENGMKVIGITNRKVPALSHMIVYKTGSSSDPLYKSGLAHFVEHMMFKSTGKLKEGDFFRIITENGGELNAYTNLYYTGYYENVTNDKLELVMAIESDRMTKLNLNKDEIDREREVIIQERNLRYDNSPKSLLLEQMNASLYINHPNHRPVIGWKHEIENLNIDDVRKFYNEHYKPSNAILVVSGDIKFDELKLLAEKYYGKIRGRKTDIIDDIATEAPQIVARKVILCDNRSKIENITRLYQIPLQYDKKIEQYITLSLIEHILGGTKYSRLYKSLINEKKIAYLLSTSHYNINSNSPAAFYISVDAAEKIDLKQIESEINRQIIDLYNVGVKSEEIEQAKKSFISSKIFIRESFKESAYMYAFMAANDLPFEYLENFEEYLNKINIDQVNSLIKNIFIPQRSVTGLLFNDSNKCDNYVY